MRLRFLSLLALPLLVLTGCQTTDMSQQEAEAAWVPPEARGENVVEVNEDWSLESNALHVERDRSRKTVLIAEAQDGCVVRSLRAPRHTRVATIAYADQVYYDAFQERFTLVGNPRVEQGRAVTSKAGPSAKMYLFGDGAVKLSTTADTYHN